MTTKLLPDQMSIKSICLDCKHYERKLGTCSGKNPFAKTGPKSYLLLDDKSSCFGFKQTRKKT